MYRYDNYFLIFFIFHFLVLRIRFPDPDTDPGLYVFICERYCILIFFVERAIDVLDQGTQPGSGTRALWPKGDV